MPSELAVSRRAGIELFADDGKLVRGLPTAKRNGKVLPIGRSASAPRDA